METPTPLPTETPTAELTELPTAALPETATPTETAVMTMPAETLPAPSATAAPTGTPTLPAFPPEPALSLLFADNFDAGQPLLWTLGEGWAFVPSENGLALGVTSSDAPVTFVHNTLEDAAVQARFHFTSGMARLSLRQSEAGSYTALLDAGGQVALYRGSQVMGAATVTPTVPDAWRTLRLSAIGDLVRVAVDGLEVIAARDAAPLPAGTLSFASVGQNALVVDDVEIWWSGNSNSTSMVILDEPTWLYECDFRASPGDWTSVPIELGYTSIWDAGEGWTGVYDPKIPFIRRSVDKNTSYRITGVVFITRLRVAQVRQGI